MSVEIDELTITFVREQTNHNNINVYQFQQISIYNNLLKHSIRIVVDAYHIIAHLILVVLPDLLIKTVENVVCVDIVLCSNPTTVTVTRTLGGHTIHAPQTT